jgi:secreted PhoX family phosphatase
VKQSHPTPSDIFNNEDSNTTANPHIDTVVASRLSRRSVLLGGAGAAATTLLSGVAMTGCASTLGNNMSSAGMTAPVSSLGFSAVGKSLADQVMVAPGYKVDVIYALGDPLTANTPAFKNDGTDALFEQRAGDHHDGMEWFGLDANGKPSATSTNRALLAVNHEATTDEKLSSFLHPRRRWHPPCPALPSEVDKELAIHGLSVVEIEAKGGQWRLQALHPVFNRRVTAMTDVLITGPARGSAHLVTKYSPDATRARGTLNNCGTGKTPWGTFVSGEENWAGYFFRDAKDDERRGKKDKQVAALNRYGRKAGACQPPWLGKRRPADDKYVRWNNGAWPPLPVRLPQRNEHLRLCGRDGRLRLAMAVRKRTGLGRFAHESVSFAKPVAGQPVVAYMGDDSHVANTCTSLSQTPVWDAADANPANRLAVGDKYLDKGRCLWPGSRTTAPANGWSCR